VKKEKTKKEKTETIRDAMQVLRSKLDGDANCTPLCGETLKEFHHRTKEYWTDCAAKNSGTGGDGTGTGTGGGAEKRGLESVKNIKREGFMLAELRFKEVEPLLHEFAVLEQQQREIESRK